MTKFSQFFHRKHKYLPKITISKQEGFSCLKPKFYSRREWYWVLLSVRGTIIWDIVFRVFIFTLISVVMCILNQLGFVVPKFNSDMHTIVGSALGLLLVYRSNTAYDRYWEARRTWEELESACTGLMRFIKVRESEMSREKLTEVANLILSFVFLCKQSLRGVHHPEEYIFLLDHKQTRLVEDQKFKPLVVSILINKWIKNHCHNVESKDNFQQITENYIEEITNCFGILERIANTPVPFSYIAHLHHILLGFLITLPMFLLADYGWYTTVCTAFISFSLLGIDQSATEIESPFGMDRNDLPLDTICLLIQEKMLVITDTDFDMTNIEEFQPVILDQQEIIIE